MAPQRVFVDNLKGELASLLGEGEEEENPGRWESSTSLFSVQVEVKTVHAGAQANKQTKNKSRNTCQENLNQGKLL